ncbi:MAG TPA: hypothetical protein VGK99_21740 [Acidobacteriota bacterium]
MNKRQFQRFGAYFAVAVLLIAPVSGQLPAGQTADPKAPRQTSAETGITPTYALGDVASIDSTGRIMTLSTKVGEIKVQTTDKTQYLRVPPGEKTLEKAENIKFEDVGVGDRVLARGKVSEDQKTVPARQVIVMTKAAIAQKHDRDREEWQRRGLNGTVSALNPVTREITVTTRSLEGQKSVVVATGENVQFRRYAPDSVKFSDARPSAFQDLKVGDQVRALGDKNADGTRLQAEMVVSGSFVMAGGQITSVNPATGELTINNIPTGKPLTVVVNKDTVLRRFPAQLAAMIAMRTNAGEPGGSGMSDRFGGRGQQGRPRPAGDATAGPGSADRPRETSEATGRGPGGSVPPGGQQGERPRMMGGGGDIQTILERLPAVSLADLKPGEMILVSSTVGANPSRVTAIILAAGVEALLIQPAQSAMPGASLGLPSGVLDLGIGLP